MRSARGRLLLIICCCASLLQFVSTLLLHGYSVLCSTYSYIHAFAVRLPIRHRLLSIITSHYNFITLWFEAELCRYTSLRSHAFLINRFPRFFALFSFTLHCRYHTYSVIITHRSVRPMCGKERRLALFCSPP